MTSHTQSSKTSEIPALILASSSPWRRMLLDRLQLPYRAVAPDVDESARGNETVQARTERLARIKAEAIDASEPALVIGSDQLACIDGQALGKPGCFEKALEQLLSMRGRCVEFFTAIHVRHTASGQSAVHMDRTRVHLRDFSYTEAEYYLRREQPWNCAGSFKSEGLGIALFERIESTDPTALIGLPLIALSRMLHQLGLPVLAPRTSEETPQP